MEGVTMSSIINDIGVIFGEAIEWVGTVASTVTSNPLLLLFSVIGFVGLGVGIFSRLTGR